MREIKYRTRNHGIYLYSGDHNNFLQIWMFWQFVHKHGLEVEQFIGIKDNNKIDIYEKDIVLCGDDGEYFPQKYDDINDEYIDTGKYMIEWASEDGYPAFELSGRPVEGCNGISYALAVGGIEVVGNIHENPELLEIK